MTKPVAYLAKNRTSGTVNATINKWESHIFENIPLYTAEQLHSRVKMTQAEFDEFLYFYERYRFDTTTIAMLSYIRINKDGETKNLYHRFYDIGTLNGTVEAQFEFSLLWVKFDSNNPEKTIEIVPDMKWFVRRILPNTGGNMLYCTDEGELTYNYSKEYATQFDTKEEAEKWTNPLTEAVQLSVEDE